MPSHVMGKPNAEQYCMMSADSKNVYGDSRLQSPNFTLKLQGCAKVKLGLCISRVPIYIFGILFHH